MTKNRSPVALVPQASPVNLFSGELPVPTGTGGFQNAPTGKVRTQTSILSGKLQAVVERAMDPSRSVSASSSAIRSSVMVSAPPEFPSEEREIEGSVEVQWKKSQLWS